MWARRQAGRLTGREEYRSDGERQRERGLAMLKTVSNSQADIVVITWFILSRDCADTYVNHFIPCLFKSNTDCLLYSECESYLPLIDGGSSDAHGLTEFSVL